MKKKAFTLIEVIVVISILGLVIPLIFNIIFVIFRQQLKIYRLSYVKNDGDFVINSISTALKNNALKIYSQTPIDEANLVCDNENTQYTSSTSLYFTDKDNQWFGYSLTNGSVSSQSANGSFSLNSSRTLINNFNLRCYKNNFFDPSVVSVSFDICFKQEDLTCNSSRAEEIASLHYQTVIKLRNK